MEATLVAPSTTVSHPVATTHQVTGVVPNPFPRDLIPQRAPAYTLHDTSPAAIHQPLIRPHTAPSATTHSLDAAGEETQPPQDLLIEVTEGHDIGQDQQEDDDVRPSLENLQESCLSALLKLFPVSDGDGLMPPMMPTISSLRRHSEPMSPGAGPSSSAMFDASAEQTPLHQLVTSLRRRDPLSPITSNETLLQEIERRLPTVASTSLQGPSVSLANTLVSLLVNIQKLSDLEEQAAPPGTTSRPTSSHRSSSINSGRETNRDMYAALGEQLLKARNLHRSRSLLDVRSRPDTHALWARIDGDMETILRLCREGTPAHGLTPGEIPSEAVTPGSFREPTRQSDYFDHLPPDYQDEDESPAYELPGYDRLDEFSGRLLDKKREKEKEGLDSDSDSEQPKLSEKMRMDLESVASAIDRLYQVAPQLSNQRVELKRSKLAEMEIARLRGGHGQLRNTTSESALQSETEKLVGRGRIASQSAEPSKRFSAESLSRRLDPKGKGKAREDAVEVDGKKKEDLDRILNLIGRSTGDERRIVDQRVDAHDFEAKVERAKARDENQREQLVDRLVQHSGTGRLKNQDAIFVRAALRPPGPKEFMVPQQANALLSLGEFMEEALPPASLSRTLDPNALLTLPEFFEEQRKEMEQEEAEMRRKQKEIRRKSSASTRSMVAGTSTGRKEYSVLAPPVSSPNPVTLLKKLTRSRSNSAPPLNFSWFKHSSSSYKTADRSLPVTREASGQTQDSDPEQDSVQVLYVAEFQKNINSMQVYLRFASGEPRGHVEFEVLPTQDGTLTGSESFVVRNGSTESQVLPLPVPANVGHHEVKVVKGHMEIKLDIPALAEIPAQPDDDLSRLLPADELKAMQPTSFICASCSLPLIHCNRIKGYRDLPSEHWEEFVEAWMCHQDQKLTEEIGRHRQGAFVPDKGIAFVGGSYVLFDDEMVVRENLNITGSVQQSDDLSTVRCLCGSILGRSQHLNSEERLSFRLAKYALRPTRPNLEPLKIPLSAFVVADMLELRQVHAAHRFIIRDEEEDNARILIWLFNPSIKVSYTSATHYTLPAGSNMWAAKVFYSVVRPGSSMSLSQKRPEWSLLSKIDQKALLSVARTCQAFTEVALDLLYHNVSLENLLQVWCASGILKTAKKRSAKSQKIVFDRVPDSSKYQRMTYYSRRVRKLSVSCQDYRANRYGTNFFPTLIELITSRRTEHAELFPQLKSLHWSGAGEIELVSCEAIIQASPRLEAFSYGEQVDGPEASTDSWPTLLRTLASVQSLERIDLGWRMSLGPGGRPSPRVGLALSCLITKPNLKELELPDHVVTSPVVMSSFASARQLEKLTLSSGLYPAPIKGGGAEVPRAASSDRLSYIAGSPDGIKSILAAACIFRALTTLSTDAGGDHTFTWSFARTFFDLVGNGCPVLKNLYLGGFVTEGPADQIRAHFVLAPLRACTRMQRFLFLGMAQHGAITVPQDFNPTDSDWRYLISEWPDLQHISYTFSAESEDDEDEDEDEDDPSSEPKPRATINTLMEFSRSCRQLVSIVVSLNATSQDMDAALLGDILPFGSSMKSINFIGTKSIEDGAVEGLATLLLRLTRDDVEFYSTTRGYGLDMSSERNWLAVKKLIDFTRKARPLGHPLAPLDPGELFTRWSFID